MKKNVIILLGLMVLSLPSCDKLASKAIKGAVKQSGDKIIERGAREAAEEAAEKAAAKAGTKLTAEAMENSVESAAKIAFRDLAKSDNAFKKLYDDFSSMISKDFADGISSRVTREGVELASEEFPNSAAKISKTTVIAKSGSLKNSGPVNEFLNHLIPGKTYMVDDAFVYNVDNLGRVASCSADRTKAFTTIERNTQRNTDIQKLVIDKLGGTHGMDDAGHLFANTTGGPNELINQVPMAKTLNRNGQWRELERIEEEALKQGKKVVSQRRLLYHGDEMRPYAIEFISKIDGVETKTIVKNIDL